MVTCNREEIRSANIDVTEGVESRMIKLACIHAGSLGQLANLAF